MSSLRPNVALAPFNCDVYPAPFNKACEAEKQAPLLRYTAPGSCSRLPPQFQAQCRAFEPPNPNSRTGDYSPYSWPNTTSPQPAAFARARQACSALDAPQFYNCLWSSVTPQSTARPLVNAAYYPCTGVHGTQSVSWDGNAPVAPDGTRGLVNEPQYHFRKVF